MLKKLLIKLFSPRVKQTTAGEIAKMFELELSGDENTRITGVAPIADASAGDITFYSTEQMHETFKILPVDVLKNTKASVILLQPEMVKNAPKGATLLITESPRAAVIKILSYLFEKPKKPGIRSGAIIKRGAKISRTATIESGAFIGSGAIIGDGVFVSGGAWIDNATIGKNCTILPNAVIGKDGFGFARVNGQTMHIPHVGRVVIGENVSIGACAVVERGTISDTIIGDFTQVGDLVKVGHNAKIGKECLFAGNIAIAGAVEIGNRVMIGGGTVITNKAKIGDDVNLGGASAVLKDLPSNGTYLGVPAINARDQVKQIIWLRNNALGKKTD
ncbi:MAG: UDP-3-O-(3-hydroxymyristoyl)glucosamine N-acyltransferase [Alphaproteobacteria bacterium]|nr:UDP-3-O-(3-hydroxymyristoyl)glucosamine N-acyltransferase [Alphaproteobacteria bacterium]